MFWAMTFIYRCPATAQKVQGWIADDRCTTEDNAFHAISCLACRQVHLVNATSGKVAAAAS
jgi:hypothetical protein